MLAATISYCSFSSLIWSSIVIILLYIKKIFSKYYARSYSKSYGLSDASVTSLTKKEYGSAVYFL